jgi:hypothetical protein
MDARHPLTEISLSFGVSIDTGINIIPGFCMKIDENLLVKK